MTNQQFNNLKVGDYVKLSFSINPMQVVVEIDKDKNTISSKPEDEEGVTYINNYKCIEFIGKPEIKESKEKELIISLFKKFVKNGCDNCPFKFECDNTYSETRGYTTNALTICDAINKKEIDWD